MLLLHLFAFAQHIDLQKLDSYIAHVEQHNRGIGSISISKDGKEIYHRSFGQQYLKDVRYNADTKYQIGSITKMITATLVFKLVDKKKIYLDTKLSAFFPQIPNADSITIKQMLEHRSGLGDYVLQYDTVFWLKNKVTEKEILNEIIRQGTLFSPAERVAYSNSAYYLLRKIVEQGFGKPYAKIVEQEIARPLGLKNFESLSSQTTDTFKSYQFNDNWTEMADFEFSNVIGVGDMLSTTRNLNTFLFGLFQLKLISESALEAMLNSADKKEFFGRGIMRVRFDGRLLYGHGGDTRETHSFVLLDKENGIGIAYSLSGERFFHNDFLYGAMDIVYGKEYDFPDFNEISLKPEELDLYLGTYTSSEIPLKLNISKDESGLIGQAEGQ
jgi:D-alanyl-D-alanine carboxypeptidase